VFVHTEHVSGMKGLPIRPSFNGDDPSHLQHVGGCQVVWEQEGKSETAVVVIIEFTFCDWKFSITVVVTHWIIICRKILTERGKKPVQTHSSYSYKCVQLFRRPSMLLQQFTCKYISHYPTPDFHGTWFLAGCSIALTLVYHSSTHHHTDTQIWFPTFNSYFHT